MQIEEMLWEATRPAFKVRYIHDGGLMPRAPLYASFGIAGPKSARAKLARIVARAPEVVVKVTGRQRGSRHVKAHLDYIGRKGKLPLETRDGELLASRAEISECAREWSDSLNWRTRASVSSVSLIFSMPAGTDPGKVLGAVRAVAEREFGDNHDYVMALHTDTPRPHVHLTVQAEGLDRTRFNPRPPQLNRLREQFARALRERGVAAEATPRRARGQGIAGSSMALVKLRTRLRIEGGKALTNADVRTNRLARLVALGQEVLPPFVERGRERWQRARQAYAGIAFQLERSTDADDRRFARALRGFLLSRPTVTYTPAAFADRHAARAEHVREGADRSISGTPPERARSR